jgi:hypothetical protein
MSDPSAFGFGQFVPGFDFLQNLSKTAAQAQPAAAAAAGMPGMASWVAPTLSIEDIDKRIQELKSVLFWLEQNTTALKATIQAMEVQKMTLTTLQSMNVNMADLAKAFTAKPPSSEPASTSSVAPDATPVAPKPSLFTPKPAAAPVAHEPAQPQSSSAADTAQEPAPQAPSGATDDTSAAKPAVDPMQWWGALTQQFQGIAAAALKDVAAEAMKAGVSAKASRVQAAAPGKAGKASAKVMAKGVAKGVAQKPQVVKTSAKAPSKSARQAPAKVASKTAVKTVAKAKSAPRKVSSK